MCGVDFRSFERFQLRRCLHRIDKQAHARSTIPSFRVVKLRGGWAFFVGDKYNLLSVGHGSRQTRDHVNFRICPRVFAPPHIDSGLSFPRDDTTGRYFSFGINKSRFITRLDGYRNRFDDLRSCVSLFLPFYCVTEYLSR